MKKRVLVGVLMSIAFLVILYVDFRRGGFPYGFSAIFAAGCVFGMREFLHLFEAGGARFPKLFVCASVLLFAVIDAREAFTLQHYGPGGIPLADALAVCLVVLVLCAAVVRGDAARVPDVALLALGIFYIWTLGSYSSRIRHMPVVGEAALLWYVVVNKATDAGAYFTGKAIGRHKLIPKVSPGKTVEGSVGGLVLGLGAGLLVWKLTPLSAEFPLALFIPVSLVSQVAGQFGDLVESLMKRSVQLKDSAAVFPGMGGVLDVIDCLLLTAPVTYYALETAMHLKGRLFS